MLATKATFEGDEREVHVRVASRGGDIYLDLVDAQRRVVKISAKGWDLAKDVPVHFRRPRGLKPLPVPAWGGDIWDLKPFLNVATDDDLRLIVSVLVSAYFTSGPFPVLLLLGEQGRRRRPPARCCGF